MHRRTHFDRVPLYFCIHFIQWDAIELCTENALLTLTQEIRRWHKAHDEACLGNVAGPAGQRPPCHSRCGAWR